MSDFKLLPCPFCGVEGTTLDIKTNGLTIEQQMDYYVVGDQ